MLYRLKIQVPHCVKTTMNLSFPSLSLTLSHSLSLFLLQPSFVCSHVSFFYKTISNISKISLYQLFLRLSPLKGRTKPGIQMADIRGYDPLNILNPPRLPPLNSPDPIFNSGRYPQFGYWVLPEPVFPPGLTQNQLLHVVFTEVGIYKSKILRGKKHAFDLVKGKI